MVRTTALQTGGSTRQELVKAALGSLAPGYQRWHLHSSTMSCFSSMALMHASSDLKQLALPHLLHQRAGCSCNALQLWRGAVGSA